MAPLTIFVMSFVFASQSFATTIDPQAIFAGLSPTQESLFSKYAAAELRASLLETGSLNLNSVVFDARIMRLQWNQLSLTEALTFAAITHALEHTKLADGTNALSLIDSVNVIRGRVLNARPPHEFNLDLTWRSDAVSKLMQAGFVQRVGWGHGEMWGMTYKGGAMGLHVLFSKRDNRIGSVHIDYRNFGLGVWHGWPEGHFTPRDADVSAVGPEHDHYTGEVISNPQRYIEWFGPIQGLN